MKRRLDLSIGQRLALGFGAAGALIVTLVALTHLWNGRVTAIRRELNAVITPRAEAVDRLETAVLYVGISARNYVLSRDGAHRRSHEEAVERVRAESLALAELPRDDPEGGALIARLGPLADAYEAAADALVAGAGGPSDALEPRVATAREELLAVVRAYAALQHQRLLARRDEVTAAVAAMDRAALGVGALVVAVFVLTALVTARSVRGPTLDLVASARRIGAGEFARAAELIRPLGDRAPRRDEVAELARAFGRMALALAGREERLEAGARLAVALARTLERRELCAAALELVTGHLGVECAALYLAGEGGDLRLEHGVGFTDGDAALAVGQGIPGRAAAERRTVVVSDLPADGAFTLRLGVDRLPPRTVVAVPMVLQGEEVAGVLVLASARAVPGDAISFAERAAVQLGVSLQNARGHERIQRLAAELRERNERLQLQQEELQAQNEELQAQQEELQAQQEELQSQNEELQAQGDELRRSEELLRLADRNKNDFLAVLSHELRNPLAPIQNSLHVLDAAAPGSPQARRAQQVVARQVRQLARLIEDLLDLTRISNGKVRLRRVPVDLGALVRQAAEDHASDFTARGVELAVEIAAEPRVEGDPARLSQTLGNLLQNAAKFTPRGGRVAVRLEAEGGRARIRVEDTGAGMDPATLGRIFQPFVQADATLARTDGGLGLGLALVKGLVELHGGAVRAESEGAGRGAVFTVDLPLHHGAAAAPAALCAPSPPRRVLVVEDNVDAAESLRDALALSGHAVEIVHRGAEGIARAREWRPDAVLCDIGLPDMEGHDVARALRREPALGAVLLVALTGYALPEDQRRAAEAGFDAHLAKPPDLGRLDELLSGAGSARLRG